MDYVFKGIANNIDRSNKMSTCLSRVQKNGFKKYF